MKPVLKCAAVVAVGAALSGCATGIPRDSGAEAAIAAAAIAIEKALERGPGNDPAGPAVFQLDPPRFSFGLVNAGETRIENGTLRNVSGRPLVLQELAVSGPGFSLVSAARLPITIAAGGTLDFGVRFETHRSCTCSGQLRAMSDLMRRTYALSARAWDRRP